ncbi:uncharacterized protein F4812DRAFT_161307 [Daldinia caldariorum]|uniref:uncharacterized protein n=1 Tax=Daldinia caldariorum TaxID=326644 RepID=UPI0020083CB8|nr:uncharacterized protein F4812DRAFT_161307 [Daldinia caldariorum]KAI1464630.1 hypothetical protein F4812DRAFT_161307 [Daldinia caldariorum]
MTSTLSEKGFLGEQAAYTPTQTKRCIRHRLTEKMPSPRHFLTLFLSLLVTAGLASAVLHQTPSGEETARSETEHVVVRDDSTFSRLLNSASPRAIHEFLHAYFPGTYKHGVYDSDRSAMEAVHANDPELATSIVQMAKRQSSNETITTTATSATADSSSSSSSSSAAPTSDSTTTQETSTSVESTTHTSESTTESTSAATSESTSDAPTSTSNSVTTTVTSTTRDSTTTSTSESSAETTSIPGTTLTTATTPTTPTSAPTTTRAHRTSTFTSTLPGGAKTTITSVEVVTPGAPEEASQTSEAEGSLQSGPAVLPARRPVVEVIIGVVVGGALLA